MLHPTSLILIYLLAALAIPGLPFFILLILLLLAVALLIVQRRAPLRLLWRTRWLLLILLLGYAYSMPGDSVWQALGGFAPTWQGLQHGAGQAVRLIVLLLWLDALVLRLPADELLSGLYQLLQPLLLPPLSWLGFKPSRIALRLGLTLRAIEEVERGRGNLKRLLTADFSPDFSPGFSSSAPEAALPHRVQLRLSPLRVIDVAVPAGLLCVMLLGWMSR